ncbi:uncharacterized protein LOC143879227 [Tasmannia lanceolata]|uniref:uncharacterized protein LOC143879227 n=1 Tax=Tasmannia lanceolata TaxID=3420 RepID=UPI0040637BD7
MAPIEDLFMQIFERRDSIVNQLKRQQDLYDQSLASSLIINEIRPPSWLWNAGSIAPNLDPKELKKEDLISGFLFPPPRAPVPSSSGCCTHYNKPVFKDDNRQLSDSLIVETCASKGYFDAADRPVVAPKSVLNDSELGQRCTEILVLDSISASPAVQMDGKISEMYFEPDQVSARFQRSRTRQKALEHRNSLNGKRRKHELEECVVNENYTGRVTRSQTAQRQPKYVQKPLKQENSSGIINEYGGRATRSRSAKPLNFVGGDELRNVADSQTTILLEYDVNKVFLSSNDVNNVVHLQTCAAGIGGTELVLNVPGAVSSFHSGLNMVDTNCQLGSEFVVSSSPAINSFVEPKQLVFDDIEECSLNHSPALGEEKQESSLIVKAVLEPAQSSNGETMFKDFKEKNDFSADELLEEDTLQTPEFVNREQEPRTANELVEKCLHQDLDDLEGCSLNLTFSPSLGKEKRYSSLELGTVAKLESSQSLKEEKWDSFLELGAGIKMEPAQSSKRKSPFDDIREKHDLSTDDMQQEKKVLLRAGFFYGEEETFKVLNKTLSEERLELEEAVEPEQVFRITSYICKPSNLSPPSSENRTSENCGDAFSDTFPLSNSKSNDIQVPRDHLYTSQEVSGKISLADQLQANFDLPEVVMNPEIVSFAVEKCIGELDGGSAKIIRDDYQVAYGAKNGTMKSTSSDFNDGVSFPSSRKSEILKALETACYDDGKDPVHGSLHRQTITRKANPICSAGKEGPYFLRSHDKDLGSSKSNVSHNAMNSLRLTITSSNACGMSWPMRNRRKTEGRLDNVFNTSPRLRQGKPLLRLHELIVDQSNADIESPGSEMDKKRHKTKGSVLSPKLQLSCSTSQINEDDSELDGKDQGWMIPMELKPTQVESSLDFGMSRQADGNSQGCLKDIGETAEPNIIVLNVKKHRASDDGIHFIPVGGELPAESPTFSASTEGTIAGGNSHRGEHGLCSYYSGGSSHHEVLDFIDAEESMPEFEGFSIGVPPKNILPSAVGGEITFDGLKFSSITKEQVHGLEQLGRSSSLLTPLPHSSTKYKIHTTPDVYPSLPNGLMEHIDLRSRLLFNGSDDTQLKEQVDGKLTDIYSNFGMEVDGSLQGHSYSDCMPSSSFQFGWDAGRPYTPTVVKHCHRIISKSTGAISGKHDRLNAELTCFRIDEDSCTNEENGDLDEVMEPLHERIGSRKKNISNSTVTHVDVTSGKFQDRDSLDSVNTELNLVGTQICVKKKPGNGYGNGKKYNNRDKENQNPSLVGNSVITAAEAPHNRFSRSKLSGKASENKRSQTFSQKGCKFNNIVSNISSFIPFVQQKQQSSTVLTGKRDIKVRALEAAEAVKRLEEKRENERKMRKEAAKIERAKLEQENIRQLELKQKKKEEERKKKEADMATRKRQREEDERKEKERKRRCNEEARRQQRGHDEKLRAEKVEKELRRKAMDEEGKKKGLAEETKKKQKAENEREGVGCRTRTTDVTAGDPRCSSNICEDTEIYTEPNFCGKVMNNSVNRHKENEDGISVIEVSQEVESYEISPYQGSDDEEEEEDDIAERKFIPLWAREKCLARYLYSLQHVDPTKVFPRERCCSLSEVLLPR